MKIKMEIALQWDKAGGETLQEFKAKYEKFKEHIERLQVSGALPRNEITWALSINKPPLNSPTPVLNPYETPHRPTGGNPAEPGVPGVPRFRNGPSFGHVPYRPQREL